MDKSKPATVTKIIHNGHIITTGSEEVKIILNGAIAISNDLIVEVGGTSEILTKYYTNNSEREQIVLDDAHGQLVMPGFVCAHGHYYGMYARGMDLKDSAPVTFLEVLERLWWRLDRALDDDANYHGAMVLSLEGLLRGTTCILDHHASPEHIVGSLDAIAKATQELGIRACLCYEVTDRNGKEGAELGIQENIRFMKRCASTKNPLLGATFGLHAPFTLSDETLDKCHAAMKEFRTEHPGVHAGFHVHVAEGKHDEDESERIYGKRCIPRLEDKGILGPDTIVGHGVYLDKAELEIIAKTKTCIVTNPESNMNNAVGLPDIAAMREAGITVGLGTDGMTYDMLQEYKASCLAHKLGTKDPRAGTLDTFNMLFRNNSLIASRFFPHPVGRLEPGCYADIVLIDYHSPTPLAPGNLPWHLHFGVTSAAVTTVYVGGKQLVKDKKILTVDEDVVYERARASCPKVWDAFSAIVSKEKK